MKKAFCDKCTKEISEIWELQEMHTIAFRGGYSSVFGDGVQVVIDLCQHCLHQILTENSLLTDKTTRDDLAEIQMDNMDLFMTEDEMMGI